jgi:hypothetical protein
VVVEPGDGVELDRSDLALIEELGLTPISAVQGEHSLGRVDLEDGSWVDVTVQGPIQCWTFLIWTEDGRRYTRLETGSGTLSAYWPFAEAIAEGMVKCTPVDP